MLMNKIATCSFKVFGLFSTTSVCQFIPLSETLIMEDSQFESENKPNLSMYNHTIFDYNESYYFYVYEDVIFWKEPQLVILVVLFIFIVFGNVTVLVAIGLSKGRKTRMNVFIANLAISDLTVGLFNVTTDIAEHSLVTWHGGAILCKIVRFLQVMVMYASTFMVVALSIDRVDAIARPMNFTRKALTVRILVSAAWILAGIFSIPSFFLWEIFHHTDGEFCMITGLIDSWHWQLYTVLVSLTAFIIPALIIIICYGIIIFVIWDKGRGFSKSLRSQNRNKSDVLKPYGSKGIIPQAKIKTVKMTLVIVCVFILCWCPYFVFNLTDVFRVVQKSPTHKAITSLIQSLAPLNSAANPLIYGIFSTRICQNLRRIKCIDYIYSRFCQCCTIKGRVKNSQLSSEQTNLDVTSGRTFTSSRRGYKCLASVHTTDCGNFRRRAIDSANEVNYLGGNIKDDINDVKSFNSSNGFQDNEEKPFLSRRHSGLPLVTRKITDQETIMLETYRAKRIKASSEKDLRLSEINQNTNICRVTNQECNHSACETQLSNMEKANALSEVIYAEF